MLRWPGGCCRRFLPRQTVPGLWPNGCCDPVAAAEFQGPPEAGAPPSRGGSWAGAALPEQAGAARLPPAATAGRRGSRSGSRGSNRRSRQDTATRLLPGGGAVPARRGGAADAARPQGSSRLGRGRFALGCCTTLVMMLPNQPTVRLVYGGDVRRTVDHDFERTHFKAVLYMRWCPLGTTPNRIAPTTPCTYVVRGHTSRYLLERLDSPETSDSSADVVSSVGNTDTSGAAASHLCMEPSLEPGIGERSRPL